jgi:hypothetical protein
MAQPMYATKPLVIGHTNLAGVRHTVAYGLERDHVV